MTHNEILRMIKENNNENFFHINFWIRALALYLFCDIFLTLYSSNIKISITDFSVLKDIIDFRFIGLFILTAILCIIFIYLLILFTHLLYIGIRIKLDPFINRYLSSGDCYNSKYVSSWRLKEHAILTKNNAAYECAEQQENAEKKFNSNSYIQLGTCYLFAFGLYNDILLFKSFQWNITDKISIYTICFLCIGIILNRLFHKNFDIHFVSDQIHKQLYHNSIEHTKD